MKNNLLQRGPTYFWIVAMWMTAVLVSNALPNNRNPFPGTLKANLLSGTWKANPAKSKLQPNHLVQGLTFIIEITLSEVLLTSIEMNQTGRQKVRTRKIRHDVKEYPVYQSPGVVEIAIWDGSHILVEMVRKDGKEIRRSRYEVSSDGCMLTVTLQRNDASGEQCEEVMVFDYAEDELEK